jgi:hypothetical protein
MHLLLLRPAPFATRFYVHAAGQMPEIMDLSLRAALATLPAEERAYTGSAAAAHWPYEQQ